MGFSFRKSFKVGGVRFTASKSGLSGSVGPRGLKLGANTRGKRRISAGKKGFRWTRFF